MVICNISWWFIFYFPVFRMKFRMMWNKLFQWVATKIVNLTQRIHWSVLSHIASASVFSWRSIKYSTFTDGVHLHRLYTSHNFLINHIVQSPALSNGQLPVICDCINLVIKYKFKFTVMVAIFQVFIAIYRYRKFLWS